MSPELATGSFLRHGITSLKGEPLKQMPYLDPRFGGLWSQLVVPHEQGWIDKTCGYILGIELTRAPIET